MCGMPVLCLWFWILYSTPERTTFSVLPLQLSTEIKTLSSVFYVFWMGLKQSRSKLLRVEQPFSIRDLCDQCWRVIYY